MVNSKKKLFFKIFLVLIIICFFCLAELFIRYNKEVYSYGYRRSKNERLIFELEPGYLIKSSKALISRQGLNDRYFPPKKDPEIFRIAVVGDSVSFGWKVGPENSFPKVLESILKEDEKKKFEVINFSVPGYNISQEYELIKTKVLKFEPDLVVLVYCCNDFFACNYFQSKMTVLNFLYNKSFLVRALFSKLDFYIDKNDFFNVKKIWTLFKEKVLAMYYPEELIYPYPGLEAVPYKSINTLDKNLVPQKYWYMLGEDNYKIYLTKIAGMLKERNINLVALGYFREFSANTHKQAGVVYKCDLKNMLNDRNILWEEILIPGDGHFTAEGHKAVAQYLYQFLRTKGIL